MNVSLKSLIMKDIFIYYLINLIFYMIEIVSFIFLYSVWPYEVFWLNAGLRGLLSIFFAITVKNIVFTGSNNFYFKFATLVLISPFASSIILEILMSALNFEIWILKISGDLIISIATYIILKR